MNRAIYYAIDDNPKYVDYTKFSIASLRRINRAIPVVVCCYGTLPDDAARWLADHGARLVCKPAVARPLLTFLKWLALPELVDTERLLFVDADTCFYQDPGALFDAFHAHTFYAREECGTSAALPPAARQIELAALAEIRALAGSRELPIFNTGVMIFNRFVHRELVEGLPLFVELCDLFERNELPYPSDNWHIREELIASIVLGAADQITCELLPPAVSPWYEELKTGELSDPGVVLHVWHHYWQEFVAGPLPP